MCKVPIPGDRGRCHHAPLTFAIRSPAILLVTDLFHPVDNLAVELFLNGDVRHHGRGRRGPMPVLLAGREPDHVTRPNFLNRASPALDPAATRREDESLTEDTLRPIFWQTDTSVGEKSWGYIRDEKFRTPESLVVELVDIVSKNGCLLLNIGPKSDGTIPDEVQKILLDIGTWLSVNGEAIYNTRPWKVYGEGPTKVVGGSFKDTATNGYTAQDIRFTAKGDTLYAIALAWPEDGKLTIKSLAAASELTKREIKTVQMLGSKAKLRSTRTADGLTVELANQTPVNYPFALEIFPVDRAAEQAE